MKAWQLRELGGSFALNDIPVPKALPGSVVIRLQASALMSYMKDYVEGRLPIYHTPAGAFVPGGNGVGVVHAVGSDVWHLNAGQRVVISSHLVATENVRSAAQMLIGVTANGEVSHRMQAYWRDGTLAEYCVVPASVVTAADGLEHVPATRLAVTMRHIVPFGGLLKGRLAAGETVVVSGATGAYGSAAVLMALAMGASRVVALGRDRDRLQALADVTGPRVVTVAATGSAQQDLINVRSATLGGADLAFDMVGGASDPGMTLTALRSLIPGGRLVLMGSMKVDLPIPYTEVMLNGWEILGNFMYPPHAYRRLLDLLRSGQIDIDAIESKVFSLSDVCNAMEAATQASSLECVVINHEG